MKKQHEFRKVKPTKKSILADPRVVKLQRTTITVQTPGWRVTLHDDYINANDMKSKYPHECGVIGWNLKEIAYALNNWVYHKSDPKIFAFDYPAGRIELVLNEQQRNRTLAWNRWIRLCDESGAAMNNGYMSGRGRNDSYDMELRTGDFDLEDDIGIIARIRVESLTIPGSGVIDLEYHLYEERWNTSRNEWEWRYFPHIKGCGWDHSYDNPDWYATTDAEFFEWMKTQFDDFKIESDAKRIE